MSNTKQFTTIDGYIASLPKDVQGIVERLRRTIRTAAPEAVETISYGIPTFNVDNGSLVSFASWKQHIGLYPVPAGDAAFQKAVAPFRAAKASVRFPIDKPIPYDLVKRIVVLRVKERQERTR